MFAVDLDAPVSRQRQLAGAAGVALGVALLLLTTSPGLPIVWDEGDSLDRAQCVLAWASGQASGLDPQRHLAGWPFTTVGEGHPALLGSLMALGSTAADPLTGGWISPLTAARCGPIALFSLAVAAAFYRLWRDTTLSSALTAVLAMITMPRLFAHAHFALFDSAVTSGWLLAWALFRPATERLRWAPLWGARWA